MPEKGYLVSEEFARRTTKAVKRVEDMARNAERIARSSGNAANNVRYCTLGGTGITAATDPRTGATTCGAQLLTIDYSASHTPGDPLDLVEVPSPDGDIVVVNRSFDLAAADGTLAIVMWNGMEWMPIWVDCSPYIS